MNLGDIYLKTVLAICVVAMLLSAVTVTWLSRGRDWNKWQILALGLTLAVASSIGLNVVGHRSAFSSWHRWQNDLVPHQYECLEYDAGFSRMKAIYSMTETEFLNWIKNHHLPLLPGTKAFKNGSVRSYDYEDLAWIAGTLGESISQDEYVALDQLGDQIVATAYATTMADKGRQLRVYHKDGRTFISYSAF